MIGIFLSCIIVSFTLIVYGKILLNFFKKSKFYLNENFSEYGLFGIIFLSFISLFSNFFFSISIFFNNLILIGAFIYGYYYINFNKNFFYTIILSALLSTLLITLNNINRPDAGLYHLPYISILNNEKIIIGLSNLHSRFGHTSIIQYTSSVFNNSLLKDNGVTIPLAFCIVYFLIYLKDKLFFLLKKKADLTQIYFLFLILIFSFYSFSNYSEYGNDAPAFVFFFLTTIIYLINNNSENNLTHNDQKIIISAIFAIFNKIFFLFIFLIPLFIILTKYKNILKKKLFFIFIFIFITIWFVKNILISSCLIYPIKITCFKNTLWYNELETTNSQISSEAWAKAWIDQEKPIINMEEFKENFLWLETWKKKHLQKINEKFTPFVIFNIFFIFFIFLKKKRGIHLHKSKLNLKKIIIILSINIIGILFWFLKFPIYRYGAAYLACFISALSVIILYLSFDKINLNKNIIKVSVFLGIFLFASVNLKRIVKNFNNSYNQYPWPKIYSLSFDNIPKEKISIKNNQQIIYYKSISECMYSALTPCTHEEKKIQYKDFFKYKIFL
jgi:hypothetical protein